MRSVNTNMDITEYIKTLPIATILNPTYHPTIQTITQQNINGTQHIIIQCAHNNRLTIPTNKIDLTTPETALNSLKQHTKWDNPDR